jgi:hypothetical protein
MELAEREELGGYTNGIAYTLLDLGAVASMRGDLNAAAEDWHKALAIEEKIAPHSRIGMLCAMDLGALSLMQGKLAQAEGYFRRAQMVAESFFAGSDDLARILTNLFLAPEVTINRSFPSASFRKKVSSSSYMHPKYQVAFISKDKFPHQAAVCTRIQTGRFAMCGPVGFRKPALSYCLHNVSVVALEPDLFNLTGRADLEYSRRVRSIEQNVLSIRN